MSYRMVPRSGKEKFARERPVVGSVSGAPFTSSKLITEPCLGKNRKVKCHFTGFNGSICSGCTRRGTPCLTQEYDDISENRSDRRPRKSPDRRSRGSYESLRQYSNPCIVRQGLSSSSDESDDAKTPASVQIFDSTLVSALFFKLTALTVVSHTLFSRSI